MVTLWVIAFLGASPLFSQDLVHTNYADSLFCGVERLGMAVNIFGGLYVLLFVLVPLSVTVVLLVITICFIKYHSFTDIRTGKDSNGQISLLPVSHQRCEPAWIAYSLLGCHLASYKKQWSRGLLCSLHFTEICTPLHPRCISHLLQTNSETAAPLIVLLYAKEKNSQTHEQAQHGERENYPRSREDYERDTNNKTIKVLLQARLATK